MSTILITGANRWMWLAWVKKFLSMWRNVIATSRSGTMDMQDDKLIIVQLDLSDKQSIQKLADDLHAKKVSIDVLYNNAWMLIDWAKMDMNREELEKTLQVNFIGPVDLTEQIKDLIPSWGKIISTSSMASSLTDATMDGVNPPYRISKAAINMYIHTLSLRLKDKNIRVVALDPGRVKTDMGGADAPTEVWEVAEYVRGLANNPELKSWGFYAQGKVRAR